MKRNIAALLLLTAMSVALHACKDENGKKPGGAAEKPVEAPQPPLKPAPEFNADSAYAFVEKQLSFGPRVPNTPEHDKCAAWLEAKLKQYAPDVKMQVGSMKAWDGKMLGIKNIIADLQPEKKNKVLLCAHWDTRPWNDQKAEVAQGKEKPVPIMGANDGASGVAVLLEIARKVQEKKPDVGVIILLVDAEDYGLPSFVNAEERNSYCLGTQFWAQSLDPLAYTASYGIVLDMVGAPNARFLQEEHSRMFAQATVNKVWSMAIRSGNGRYFINNYTTFITDDHYYINQMAHIPCIDIIDFDASRGNLKGFGDYWHTTDDNISAIDRGTLKAVGQTVLNVLFNER